MSPARQADGCPYRRPFPAGFDGCPAYQPVRFLATDIHYHPLAPVWTCGHLEVGHAQMGRAYARRGLGEAEARQRWAERIGRRAIEDWRAIGIEFGRALEVSLARIYELKAKQVSSRGDGRNAADGELAAAIDTFLAEHDALITEHGSRLAEIGFPVEPVRVLTREAMRALYERDSVQGRWSPPDHLLEEFPPETRGFLAGLFDLPAR